MIKVLGDYCSRDIENYPLEAVATELVFLRNLIRNSGAFFTLNVSLRLKSVFGDNDACKKRKTNEFLSDKKTAQAPAFLLIIKYKQTRLSREICENSKYVILNPEKTQECLISINYIF